MPLAIPGETYPTTPGRRWANNCLIIKLCIPRLFDGSVKRYKVYFLDSGLIAIGLFAENPSVITEATRFPILARINGYCTSDGVFQTQTLELVPGARWTFPVDTEAALAHTQESCYRRISGVVLAGVVPDSCKQCVVCSPACGYKQRTAANVAYYKVKGQRFREKQANKAPTQLATCLTCSSYGFKQLAQQEVCCCMFQTVDGSTLDFHPEVLRELFRKGRPVLRRSGTACSECSWCVILPQPVM